MENYYFNIIAKSSHGRLSAILILIAGLLLGSCNAIFEKDISGEEVTLILPTDNDTVLTNHVHFKWVGIDGASFYNLQIVQPGFNDISTFVLDSNIAGDDFYFILEPGDYQFKIHGENGGYKSLSSGPYSFYVDSVIDLSSQLVSLISPSDDFYSNGTEDIIVSWQNLFAADHYEYILKIGDSFDSGSILDQDLNINTLSYTIPSSQFDVEGTYHWGIKGVNTTSSSVYSSRKILVDLTRPNDPVLTSPVAGVLISEGDELTLKWTTGTDPGTVNSPVTSTVEIATSDAFIDFEEFTGITSDSLVYTFSSAGEYWWRVKAIDGVGNLSEFYSEGRQIIVE